MPQDVLVPPLGTNEDTVVLSAWYKREGEAVALGEALFAVETDKATLDVEAPASGILRAVTATAGETVPALTRIAVIAAPGEAFDVAPPPVGEAAASASTAPATERIPSPASSSPRERVFISPRARRTADEHGIAWASLCGTGPEGAIVERDVRAALDRDAITVTRSGAIARSDNEVVEEIPLSGVRGIVATRMAASSTTAAAVTLTTETDATALVELRGTLTASGVAATYNDLLLAAIGRALREHPRMNASLDGDTIRVWQRVHIGLAVDTERGLIVPVARDVDRLRLGEISHETARLVKAARDGTARPEDLRGGTFTLTNLGMFRIDSFTPIINMPECAVLGVGRIKPQPQIVDGRVVERRMMWMSLTFDHRLVDGGPAARFLQRVAELVEQPILLLC